ncbi:MAG: hypothetical protein CME19_00115 [Gemmatimonadetes bacterium]|nr:hypothetical protein [Gemmatimonadota bacterium]|tara:strand:+ start:107 stop:568 length:462 start_codon:yes stop_codon:yes gene_type:complete
MAKAKKTVRKAKKYPKKKLNVFKKILTERRVELMKQVTEQDDDIGDLRDDQPADPLDMAGNSSTLELMTTLGNHERTELAEIDHALSKIGAGTYGICEVSGELIAEPRLMAIPTARYTIEVQAEREKTSPGKVERPSRRTILSDDLPVMDDEN